MLLLSKYMKNYQETTCNTIDVLRKFPYRKDSKYYVIT